MGKVPRIATARARGGSPSGVVLAALAAGLLIAGCSASSQQPCTRDDECLSGECRPNGRCAPVTDGDEAGSPEDGSNDAAPDVGGREDASSTNGEADANGSPDGGDGAGDDAEADVGGGACPRNGDGVVERDEVTLRAGLQSTFRVATDVEGVNPEGTVEDGVRRWDLSGSLPGDEDVLVETLDPDQHWWGEEFPNATYAAELSAEEDELGVYRVTDDELQLLGLVSPDDGACRTELTYDPPATILRFPVEEGASWETESDVTGWKSCAHTTIPPPEESYATQVTAEGELATPFGTFTVLELETELDRTLGLFSFAGNWSISFVAECFGTVGLMRSESSADGPDFEDAAEVRRLAP